MTTIQACPAVPFPRYRIRSLVTLALAVVLVATLAPGALPASALAERNPALDTALAVNDEVTAHATHNLNLRAGPSLQATIQTVMRAGSTVEVTGEAQNGFYPVTFDDVEGFAHGDYLAEGAGPFSNNGPGMDESRNTSARGIVQIIYDAAAMYGQDGDAMLRVARCESTLDPSAVNRSSNASGLFQFLPGTWATTPYAGHDIFDPVANAEAAAWMWANGRRGEWVCQ